MRASGSNGRGARAGGARHGPRTPIRPKRSRRRLAAMLLLDEPRVAVGIVKGQERLIALSSRGQAGRLAGRPEMEWLACLDAALHELGPSDLDVLDAQVQPVERARR